jgi:tripeptide aminopeptidase
MNVDFLKEVLSLPSISGNESMVRDYILEFAKDNQIDSKVDKKGNVYLTKGMDRMTLGEYYPCVVSHIDTVHRSHIDLIDNKRRLDIVDKGNGDLIAYNPLTNEQTGIGGDDKCGVFVCLSLFLEMDILKGAFFVEEEIGMLGSKEADPEFFKNVGYAIQFDAPSANWITEVCSGVKIFDSEFKDKIKTVLSEGGYNNFSNDPFTDVNQLSQKFDFNCLNLGCGYYEQHRDSEYVVIDEVEKSLWMGIKLIHFLGVADYLRKDKEVPKQMISESYNYGNNYDNLQDLDMSYNLKFYDDYDENANKIVDAVFDMIDEGYSREDIKFEIGEMLYNN